MSASDINYINQTVRYADERTGIFDPVGSAGFQTFAYNDLSRGTASSSVPAPAPGPDVAFAVASRAADRQIAEAFYTLPRLVRTGLQGNLATLGGQLDALSRSRNPLLSFAADVGFGSVGVLSAATEVALPFDTLGGAAATVVGGEAINALARIPGVSAVLNTDLTPYAEQAGQYLLDRTGLSGAAQAVGNFLGDETATLTLGRTAVADTAAAGVAQSEAVVASAAKEASAMAGVNSSTARAAAAAVEEVAPVTAGAVAARTAVEVTGVEAEAGTAAAEARVIAPSSKTNIAGASSIEDLNRATALDFYMNQAGFSEETALQHIGGIDLTQPVTVTSLDAGTTLQQYVSPGKLGNYFAPVGATPLESGLALTDQSLMIFRNEGPVAALQSIAKPDYLYPPGYVVPGSGAGGGMQYFIPSKTAFKPVP